MNQGLYEKYKSEIIVLDIDVGQLFGMGTQVTLEQLRERRITYPVGFTDYAGAFRVLALPTTIFIDSKGEIFRTWGGAGAPEEIVKELLRN